MEDIYAEHHAWAVRVACNVIGDRNEAEDVVSEVFLAVFRAIQAGGGPAKDKDGYKNIRGYLRRAIQNEATRVWARRKFEDVTDDLPETSEPDPADALLRALQRERDLSGCPPMYALVIFHMDVLGDDVEDCARKLGMTTSAVKSMLHRARQALRLAA